MHNIYSEIQARGAIIDLSQRAQFQLTGSDRIRYLNGQVSADVRKLKADESLYACVMTAKGKMCADVFISPAADALRIDAEPILRENLAARLERYIIADDCELSDITDNTALFFEIPPANDPTQPGQIRSRRMGFDGYDHVVDRTQSDAYWNRLAAERLVLDEATAETLRIEQGVPRWGFELDENVIPVEAGLDRTAIDYYKGCYIGQEVISRIKSIGHVNRRLCAFVSPENTPLTPGMQLFDASEKAVGVLTSATFSFTFQKPIALGYLKRGIEPGVLSARTASDGTACPVETKELPLIP